MACSVLFQYPYNLVHFQFFSNIITIQSTLSQYHYLDFFICTQRSQLHDSCIVKLSKKLLTTQFMTTLSRKLLTTQFMSSQHSFCVTQLRGNTTRLLALDKNSGQYNSLVSSQHNFWAIRLGNSALKGALWHNFGSSSNNNFRTIQLLGRFPVSSTCFSFSWTFSDAHYYQSQMPLLVTWNKTSHCGHGVLLKSDCFESSEERIKKFVSLLPLTVLFLLPRIPLVCLKRQITKVTPPRKCYISTVLARLTMSATLYLKNGRLVSWCHHIIKNDSSGLHDQQLIY